MTEQGSLFEGIESDRPTLYIAAAMSSAPDGIKAEARAIGRLVQDVANAHSAFLQAHSPALFSDPTREAKRKTANQLYDQNSDIVHRAVGMVLLGLQGGSYGGGQEFDWAARRRLPLLYLKRPEHTISRQVIGTPAQDFHTITYHVPVSEEWLTELGRRDPDAVDEFFDEWRASTAAEDLRVQLTQWIQHRVDYFLDRPDREGHAKVVYGELIDVLRDAYYTLDGPARQRTASVARLHPRRIDELLRHVGVFAGASLDEIVTLATHLNVDLAALVSGGVRDTPLTPTQLDAFWQAADEYPWTKQEAVKILQSAEAFVLSRRHKPNKAKAPLGSAAQWRQFAETLHLVRRDAP